MPACRSAAIFSKVAWHTRGKTPQSSCGVAEARLGSVPSIVRVFPVPVCPYAKKSTLWPSSANDATRSGTIASVTSACVASVPKTFLGYAYLASPLLKLYCVSIVTDVSSHASRCFCSTVPSSAWPPSAASGRMRTKMSGLKIGALLFAAFGSVSSLIGAALLLPAAAFGGESALTALMPLPAGLLVASAGGAVFFVLLLLATALVLAGELLELLLAAGMSSAARAQGVVRPAQTC